MACILPYAPVFIGLYACCRRIFCRLWRAGCRFLVTDDTALHDMSWSSAGNLRAWIGALPDPECKPNQGEIMKSWLKLIVAAAVAAATLSACVVVPAGPPQPHYYRPYYGPGYYYGR